jgi:hypothetical protein
MLKTGCKFERWISSYYLHVGVNIYPLFRRSLDRTYTPRNLQCYFLSSSYAVFSIRGWHVRIRNVLSCIFSFRNETKINWFYAKHMVINIRLKVYPVIKNLLFVSTDCSMATGIHWNCVKINVCLRVVRRMVSSLFVINTNFNGFVPSLLIS